MESIKNFMDHNNREPPQRIIFYRDGVAHNQFELVAQQEIGIICRVLEEMGLGGSELIYMVVQKKTNARFALEARSGGTIPGKGKGKGGGGPSFGGRGAYNGPELGNVLAGTVIDQQVTDRKGFDFYMVSQHSLQATARPSHYHVLHCPPSLTQDQIQRFTFDLCHIYARCTKIASRPAPIYYAHLAAFHAPWYVSGFKEHSDIWEVQSTSSGGSGASSASAYAKLHKRQCTRLYQA